MRRSLPRLAPALPILAAVLIAGSLPAAAQIAHQKPTPRSQPAAAPLLPQECPDLDRPLISFSLDPEHPCPGDTVTLRWQVTDRRRGVAWGFPVAITAPANPMKKQLRAKKMIR